MKKKLCFVSVSFPPEILGGTNLVNYNLIRYLKKKEKDLDISWVYFGGENKKYKREGVKYIELKSPFFKSSPFSIRKGLKLINFFRKNYFDIINARTGIWMRFYKKRKNQKIIQTFHGTRYYLNKNHYERLNSLQRPFLTLLLWVNKIVDKPGKDTDKIICVSEKVRKQVQQLYGGKKEIVVIRSGVDAGRFKPKSKRNAKKMLGLDLNKTYGLYIGKGGFWTKGLDRAVRISRELHKLNNNYGLIVIGPNLKKVKKILNGNFIIYKKEVGREKMPFYYNASDIFFCLSRYEGGAPTLVVSEAMASGCLLVCSKSSEQEIIENGKNGIILENFGAEDAARVMKVLENSKEKKKIQRNAIKTINELSLDKWGKKYFDSLTK